MRFARQAALAVAGWCCLAAAGQTRLTLGEAGARQPPDYTPAHLGQTVTVRGVVNAPAFHFPAYTVLTIEDERNGAALQGAREGSRLDVFKPGDEIEATGTVIMVAGMALIQPTAQVTLAGHRQPPAIHDLSLPQLQSFYQLGRLVRTDGRIKEIGETSSGSFVAITAAGANYRVFMPHSAGQPGVNFGSRFGAGDRLQVTGVAYQYCPRPPYNGSFELLLGRPQDIARLERGFYLPTTVLGLGLAVVVVAGLLFWSRERRLRKQRETLRQTYQLGEGILSSDSPEMALRRVGEALPGILGTTRVRLYLFNRAANCLEEVSRTDGKSFSIPLTASPEKPQSGAASCFHYHALLVVPDVGRSPFAANAGGDGIVPKAQLFAPMMAHGEVVGVLEVDGDHRAHTFDTDEQALAQHLANQIGVTLRLLDQRSVQEQLFRTEKLAAVGRLISGVVNELQAPLASISEVAARAARAVRGGAAEKDLAAIAGEAQKASAMVARLVSFAAAGQGEARPVSISALLRSLIEFREGDWRASGIKLRDLLSREPMLVMGSHGQLEQVFLHLLVHAEQSLAQASEKLLTLRTSLLGRMVVVEIVFSARGEGRNPAEGAAVLGVTRSVIAGHGGEVRLIEKSNEDPRFEVELPMVAKDRSPAALPARRREPEPARLLTVLVVEPEEAAQRQLLGLLAARGHRVVPIDNTDTALDLAQRMRIDVAFCSVRAAGLNWVELAERIQGRIGNFVLLSDGYDAVLTADFEAEGRFVLAKPVQESELERVLGTVERPIVA